MGNSIEWLNVCSPIKCEIIIVNILRAASESLKKCLCDQAVQNFAKWFQLDENNNHNKTKYLQPVKL